MAQTKQKSSSKGSTKKRSQRSRSSGKSNSKTNGAGGGSRVKAKKAASSTQKKAKQTSSPNGVTDSVKSAVSSGASEVAPIAKKAAVPLLATGAAIAGVAGAIVATRSGRRRKVLGVSMPKRNGFKPDAEKISGAIVDAAKRADNIGQRMSKVASSVQSVGETAGEVAKKGT